MLINYVFPDVLHESRERADPGGIPQLTLNRNCHNNVQAQIGGRVGGVQQKTCDTCMCILYVAITGGFPTQGVS